MLIQDKILKAQVDVASVECLRKKCYQPQLVDVENTKQWLCVAR